MPEARSTNVVPVTCKCSTFAILSVRSRRARPPHVLGFSPFAEWLPMGAPQELAGVSNFHAYCPVNMPHPLQPACAGVSISV